MKKISDYENKKVLVLGLAKSGLAAAQLLMELGAKITVNDGKAFEGNNEAKILSEQGIQVICGSHPVELFDQEDFELLVKNPGIPYENPMVERAMALGIPVITEVELAYQVSEADIIGVTGTNGKTTTVTMIADILNAAGRTAKLAGNIGFPSSEVASTAKADELLVTELSSFQLMGIRSFRPKIALITNIFSAHLDYHGSQEAYEAAKWEIQKNMTHEDVLILNFNQEKSLALAEKTQARVLAFATGREVDGAYSLDGKLYYKGEVVMAEADLALPGEHNLENALAAIVVAKLLDIGKQAIQETLSHFSGVKHRNQYLGEVAGVKVYNDSKATNILATQKALSGFDNSKLWLLAGGLDRGNSFDELAEYISGLKGMIVFGETAPKLEALADELAIPVIKSENVATALALALSQAESGDSILLSPACASWDQYKTFEERGDLFISAFETAQKGA
ncbi:UDP-N-acetylmuramoyl-L-alanine--D-glutamate ligase [Lactococcus termiticola]|uniref:UDP-N-acetylmuramoylalanine--D-glutamate ligase n=1 Tax=Lactococcus termiticola TaxID=2169526 RepID=A0A2R5HJC2_9LACT|nr:UDP-N-acetylmuramoyl-L-alanine--D-glutamate ligase [Lactococcus termiticola]GBG96648.1 UDP-N-acetylmuramoylalanine--D-glutamate ligase [Lactococcus termiticola]